MPPSTTQEAPVTFDAAGAGVGAGDDRGARKIRRHSLLCSHIRDRHAGRVPRESHLGTRAPVIVETCASYRQTSFRDHRNRQERERHGMAGRRSAGILLFRRAAADRGRVEVLLGHMGGPFWENRDAGAWTVPKGEYDPAEDPLEAAKREFEEELGLPPPTAKLVDLGYVRQSGGKVVSVWAAEGDLDPGDVVPGTFELEWPKGSGRVRRFPEVDRVAWLDLKVAKEKIVAAQRVFLDRLADRLLR
jgi:predicted NUDIX family NTP pyrophosphohydrolase